MHRGLIQRVRLNPPESPLKASAHVRDLQTNDPPPLTAKHSPQRVIQFPLLTGACSSPFAQLQPFVEFALPPIQIYPVAVRRAQHYTQPANRVCVALRRDTIQPLQLPLKQPVARSGEKT